MSKDISFIVCQTSHSEFFLIGLNKKKDRKQNASLTKERFYGHGTYYKKHNAPLIPHYWLSVKKKEKFKLISYLKFVTLGRNYFWMRKYSYCVTNISWFWRWVDLNLFTTYFSHKMLLDAFAEINQNLLKIYIIHILLNFMRKLSCKQIQVNSSFISTHQCDRYLTQRSLLFQSEFQAIWFAIRKKT